MKTITIQSCPHRMSRLLIWGAVLALVWAGLLYGGTTIQSICAVAFGLCFRSTT